jgi:signal transduction histidine kinase
VAGTILMYEGLASVMVVFRDITERKAAEKKIRIAHDELEDRVKERTAALEQSNLRLEIEIAERKRAEEEMRKARDFAEAASRAKSDFLATMSHELRTPLNHIIGFTEMVVDKQFGPLNESQEEYLNDVLESSRHLLGLINDILDLAKVEAGKMALELEQVPLRALLEGSLTMVQEKALQDRISLSAELGELPDWVEGDGRKLKQVMFNLLSNAVKFTPEGGRVTVKAAPVAFPEADPNRFAAPAPVSLKNGDGSPPQTGGGLMISVEDTGIGIRAEDLERIFKPFEQVAGPLNRRHNGTGLGLPLSRRMIELHGGRIWAESEGLAKGSAFRFVLPFHLIPREGKSLWTQEPS